jgi:hypothetical protein
MINELPRIQIRMYVISKKGWGGVRSRMRDLQHLARRRAYYETQRKTLI